MAYSLPLVVVLSFQFEGIGSYLPLLYAFALVPLLELLFSPDARNLSPTKEDLWQDAPWFDWLLRLMLPLQLGIMLFFLWDISSHAYDGISLVGRISAFGLMCGVIGINVGHELGHRVKKSDQTIAKILLSTSLYVHFFTEHNYGHHRNVATPEDPASARYNESLYAFWIRSITLAYGSAWRIQLKMLKSKKQGFWSRHNDLLLWQIFQVMMLLAIGLIFGLSVLGAYLGAALIGILLLETVNYIEHYGLSRQKLSEHRYEKAAPVHSWNSDHQMGRLLLFELSRHSDHHAHPHRKYQILKHHDESPQLPTGYPGMMLLSAIPPLWFRVMNPKIYSALGTTS